MERKFSLGLTKKHFIVFGLVAAITFSGIYAFTSSAWCYGGTLMGRSCYRGYFSNAYDQWGDNVLPEIKNGQALPSTDIYNATTLYNFLRAAYFSGDAQRRTGAAFIYNTLEGNNGPGVGRNVSEAQWQALFVKLDGLDKAGKITWHGNVSADTNSYWQGPDTDDDAYYGEFKNESGILIRDYDNTVIYRLLRRCANPIGNSPGLPDPRNYTLTPSIDASSIPSQVEAGTRTTISGTVTNVGNISSKPTQWEITQINVQPGKKAPHEDENGTVSGTAPCQGGGGAPSGNYFDSGDADCKNVAKGNYVFPLSSPPKPRANDVEIEDLPVGTRVCFALSVQPRGYTDDNWAHSKPLCTVVGKKPKLQVWGGDVGVRGKILTSTTTKNVAGTSRVFGSWVEYGAFSVGTNTGFGSGSGLADQTNTSQSAWSRLTFANKNEAGADAFGEFTTAAGFRPLPGVANFFSTITNKQPITSSPTSLNSLGFTTNDAPVVRTAGDLEITESLIPKGKSVVIIATGTVTISGKIEYEDVTLNSLGDIPQVVIIAQNININENVSRVDAWLVASNTINTCANFSGSLTSEKCGGLLEVNGPVVTNRLLLNRTAGSGTDEESGNPAERFNLRADAYLWALLQSRGSNKAQTVYSTELPPRF